MHKEDKQDDDWLSEIPEEERVTDAEEARVVQLLLRDVRATLGSIHDDIVISNAKRLREFTTMSDFEWHVANDVQQQIHDEFIDTSWPACPRHPHHPLWYGDRGWSCDQEPEVVAPLGSLRLLFDRSD